jgi:hypothetical protein
VQEVILDAIGAWQVDQVTNPPPEFPIPKSAPA